MRFVNVGPLVTQWVCEECGGLVADRDVHEEWHLDVQLRPEEYDGE